MKKSPKKRNLLHPDTVLLLKQIGLGLLILLSISVVIVSVWYGTRLEALTISEIEVTGGETISHEFLQQQINEQLEGTYLRLIPRRFAYLYPEEDIIASIAGIPRIKDITLIRTGGKKLTLEVTEYDPVALWCGESEGDECLLLDEDTFAFAAAPALTGQTFLRYLTIGTSPQIGASVLTTSELETFAYVSDALEARGWQLQQVSVDTARDAFLLLSGESELVLSLKDDGRIIIDNLETVLNSEQFTELTPGEFQYIDLRFGNKVFVNRTEETVSTSTTTEGLVDFEITPDLPTEEADTTTSTAG